MGAAQPVNPLDIINTEEFDAQIYYLESYFTGTAAAVGAGAGAVGAGGVALVFLAGGLLTYDLLGNKQWNHFWLGVGGRLNDVWHKASGFLFGHQGVSLDTVGQMIQLAQHITMRGSRQLISNVMGRIMVAQAGLIANVKRLAVTINHNSLVTNGMVNSARAYAWNLMHGAEVRAIQREQALEHRMRGYVAAQLHNETNWVLHSVYQPVQREIITLNGEIRDMRKSVTADHLNISHNVLPKLAALGAAVTVATRLATAAKAFEDSCGEPMCQTVGPKTDWGKFFKRFGPAALMVLLGAVAAEDPEAVEDAAEQFAHMFGPILAHWTESWLGLISGDTGSDVAKVGAGVGQINIPGF